MHLYHVKFGQFSNQLCRFSIMQIWCQIFISFQFLLPFVSNNLSLIIKIDFPPQNSSVKTTVFKHRVQSCHEESGYFQTQCADLSRSIWCQIVFSFQFVITFCQQKLITHGQKLISSSKSYIYPLHIIKSLPT